MTTEKETDIKISIETIAKNSGIDKSVILELINRYKEDFLMLGGKSDQAVESELNSLQSKYLSMYFEFIGLEPEIISTGSDLNECKANCIHRSFQEFYKIKGESWWFRQGYIIINSFKSDY